MKKEFETAVEFKKLLKLMENFEEKFYSGPNAPKDPATIMEGYRWIFSITQVAFDLYVWGDTNKPRFVEIVGPYKKWGGDNSDAFYVATTISPDKTYRVTVNPGDAVYLSLSVYGGPDDGHWSDRIVGTLNTTQMSKEKDGTYSMILSPDEGRREGENFIKLEPDAVLALTRDYVDDPTSAQKAHWYIECLDPAPEYKEDDADLARRFRAAQNWLEEQFSLVPVGLGELNRMDKPYKVPEVIYGWQAADAAYAMGSFGLEPDEALVIRGRSPKCIFWNVCLWNQLMHTFNYDYDNVTINSSKVELEEDGSWIIIIAAKDPGLKNWISTQGRPHGRIWMRWYLPEETPDRPQTEVVKLADLNKL